MPSLLLVLLGLLAPPVAAGPDVDGRYGAYLEALDGVVEPRGAAWTTDGRLLVTGDHHVAVFDANLAEVASWGRRGTAPGQFRRPTGVAVAPDGKVYVADTGNHRVQILAPDGGWAGRFGQRGAGPGQLVEPTGVAVGPDAVYVADTGNDRVQVFDRLGRPVTRWEGAGFERPTGIARDDAGRVFVADTGNHRVVVLDAGGAVLATLGERGPFPGLFAEPRGVAVAAGRLYVADTENHRVQVFDVAAVLRGDGTPLYEWGKHALRPREGEGRLHYPDAVAVAPDGSRALVCESFVDRVQVFGPAEGDASLYAADPTVRPGIAPHAGREVAAWNRLLLTLEPESQTLQVMDLRGPSPLTVTRFGDWGDAPGRFRRLRGVAFGPKGRVFATDADAGRLQTWRLDQLHEAPEAAFRPGAAHLVQSVDLTELVALAADDAAAPTRPASAPRRVGPGALAVDPQGHCFVIDESAAVVLQLDPAWRWLRTIGAGRLQRPLDVAVLPRFGATPDKHGVPRGGAGEQRIAVSDGDLGQVLVFGPDGELDAILGAGILREPAGVAADAQGRVLVTDRALHTLHVFDVTGPEVARWGGPGLAAGEFYKPWGVAVLTDGRILVLDHGNHRGQVFQPDGTFAGAFGRRLYVDAATAEEDAARAAAEEER